MHHKRLIIGKNLLSPILIAVASTSVGATEKLGDLSITSTKKNQIRVSWKSDAVLQTADTPLSTWMDLRSANSPFTNNTAAVSEFYKLRLPDYTLYGLHRSNEVHLIDYDKNMVHSWTTDLQPGVSVYLLNDGNLLRAANTMATNFTAGGTGGRIEKLDWNSNVLWSYDYASNTNRHHHDIAPLPNGNILLIAWESISATEAIDQGRDPALIDGSEVWPETIVEIEPQGTNSGSIVWKWNMMDHIIQDYDITKANYGVVSNHPELIDFNFTANSSADWIHANAIDYNAELDQIILSANRFSEIWIIDHSTTTAEAASHSGGKSGKGGDLLYRWGNPQTYDRGTASDQIFGWQHNPNWIPSDHPGAGNIIVFNNGTHRGYSTIDEITPPLLPDGTYELLPGQPFGPTNLTWTYDPGPLDSFYGNFLGGAQRLPSGNTLFCVGSAGEFYEVTPEGNIVWDYDIPGTEIIRSFRATRVLFDLPE